MRYDMKNTKIAELLSNCVYDQEKAKLRPLVSRLVFGHWLNITEAFTLIHSFNQDEFLTQEDLNFCHEHNLCFKAEKNGLIISGQAIHTTNQIPFDVIFYLQRAYNLAKFYKFVVV